MPTVDLGLVVGSNGQGVPTGGSAGQILAKNSSSNYDAGWVPMSAAAAAAFGIVENGNAASQTIAAGQYVIWKGVLYTADAAIASGTTLAASGGNKNLTAVSGGGLNSLLSQFTNWTSFDAQIYDNDTSTGVSYTNAYYTKIGKFMFMCGKGIGSELTLSTMLQIRNLPCDSIWAGGIYLSGLSGNGGDRTLQATTSDRAYFRPNITGTFAANVNHSFWLIGYVS
jgi:hypothetical protein